MTMGLCLMQHNTFFTMNLGSSSDTTRPIFDPRDSNMTRAPHHSPPQHRPHAPPAFGGLPRYSDATTSYNTGAGRANITPPPSDQHRAEPYYSARTIDAVSGLHSQSPRSRSSRARQGMSGSNAPSSGSSGSKKRCTGAWTEAEDAKLFDLVRTFGTKNWVSVERAMEGRDKKQCRERWCNHVNPHINDAPFSEAESVFIIDCYVRHGRQWARMSRCPDLQNRPDNAIKNHFNTNLRDHYAELCRQYNIPRRQPNDLLEIDEETYSRIKGRITAPPASSMRGSKASRFVSSGSGRADVAAQMVDPVQYSSFSPPRKLRTNSANSPHSSTSGSLEPYPYAEEYRPGHRHSYDPRQAAPPSLQSRHPTVEAGARKSWHPHPSSYPANDRLYDISPASHPSRLSDASEARDVRAYLSKSPVLQHDPHASRDTYDRAYNGERFYPARQDPAFPPLIRNPNSRSDSFERLRYNPNTGSNTPSSVHLPSIGLDHLHLSGSVPTTPLDEVSPQNRSRSHSELDAEHKSLLWSSMGTLHQPKRQGPAVGPDRTASTSSTSSLTPRAGARYAPYARSGMAEASVHPSRRGSGESSSSLDREGGRFRLAGMPEPLAEEYSEYRRQVASSRPRPDHAYYQTSPPLDRPHDRPHYAPALHHSPRLVSPEYMQSERPERNPGGGYFSQPRRADR